MSGMSCPGCHYRAAKRHICLPGKDGCAKGKAGKGTMEKKGFHWIPNKDEEKMFH
jgi:hypothetical protein